MPHLHSVTTGCAAAGAAAPKVVSKSPEAESPEVLSSIVGSPFNLAIDGPRVIVADGERGLVGILQANGSVVPLAGDVPGAAGVATRHAWLAFTSTVSDEATGTNLASGLNLREPTGDTLYADLAAYEAEHNPDRISSYGPRSSDPCVLGALGPRYDGRLDAHAYSVANDGNGWLVADAGANAVLAVSDTGTVSTVAALPSQPAPVTRAAADALGLPPCVVDVIYDFEPVPTDVEVGPGGQIYVTTLPGGPEGPQLGARGSLWRIDPRSHELSRVATGFAGATNLAIGTHGEIYVAEFFAGRISVVTAGGTSPVVDLPGVVAVETAPDGTIFASTMGSEAGSSTIVRIHSGTIRSIS